jgi:hypothetical protein
MTDLFEHGGWFDQAFSQSSGQRFLTWRAAFVLFADRQGSTIVETGCQRHADDLGDGFSTTKIMQVLNQLNRGVLHTVDISKESIAVGKAAVEKIGGADRVHFHLSDSVEFLKQFAEPIDFLYLDSWDYSDEEKQRTACQRHQLREIEVAYDKLSTGAVVLLDDNQHPGGGKTKLSKQFLAERNWLCLIDWHQSLWIRSL